MSGHSKWATTKHKKAVVDAKRGKLFAKLIKNVEVAARTGGGDPAGNPTLYDAIQKAKKSSVPNDNIDRAVRRGSGAEAGGAQYENITYEGYGPGGVAVLVQCLTDNRNRAASDVRTAFSRNGGSMADPGSVSYLFHRKGVIVVEKNGVSEDDVLTAVLDAGAEEVNDLGESFEVVSEPTDLVTARTALQDAGIDYDSADTAFLPTVEVGPGRGARQEGVPADRSARGLRRRAGRVRQLLGHRRHHGEARLTADVIVRPLTPDFDWDEYIDLTMRSFGPVDEAMVQPRIEPVVAAGRCLGAFDGDRLIGTALYHDMRQWWHGRAVPMAGVAGVKVAPEYRGQGVGRALMTALTELMTEHGYPLSALYPATMTIYRSLGWEIAGHRHEAVLPSRALSAMARPDAKAAAGIRRPGPDDAAEVLEVIGRAHAGARDCGPITWDEATVRRWLTRPGRYADKDRYAYLAPDGFLGYCWRRGHEEIFVERMVASSAGTTRALWAVAASNSSVAETVHAQVGPSDPLWWMLREQDADIAERESWMLRLLDAPAAVAARGFPATDLAVPLQITDDLRPANSGRWELTVRAGAGRLSRSRTDPVPASPAAASPGGRAPLRLDARGLAALYAGTPVATLRRAGLADGGSPAADAALDGAFAATPFMLDGF